MGKLYQVYVDTFSRTELQKIDAVLFPQMQILVDKVRGLNGAPIRFRVMDEQDPDFIQHASKDVMKRTGKTLGKLIVAGLKEVSKV